MPNKGNDFDIQNVILPTTNISEHGANTGADGVGITTAISQHKLVLKPKYVNASGDTFDSIDTLEDVIVRQWAAYGYLFNNFTKNDIAIDELVEKQIVSNFDDAGNIRLLGEGRLNERRQSKKDNANLIYYAEIDLTSLESIIEAMNQEQITLAQKTRAYKEMIGSLALIVKYAYHTRKIGNGDLFKSNANDYDKLKNLMVYSFLLDNQKHYCLFPIDTGRYIEPFNENDERDFTLDGEQVTKRNGANICWQLQDILDVGYVASLLREKIGITDKFDFATEPPNKRETNFDPAIFDGNRLEDIIKQCTRRSYTKKLEKTLDANAEFIRNQRGNIFVYINVKSNPDLTRPQTRYLAGTENIEWELKSETAISVKPVTEFNWIQLNEKSPNKFTSTIDYEYVLDKGVIANDNSLEFSIELRNLEVLNQTKQSVYNNVCWSITRTIDLIPLLIIDNLIQLEETLLSDIIGGYGKFAVTIKADGWAEVDTDNPEHSKHFITPVVSGKQKLQITFKDGRNNNTETTITRTINVEFNNVIECYND